MTVSFAGQVLQSVISTIQQSDKKDFWFQISKNLSSFYCQNPVINNTDNEKESSIFSVIDNQLSRGLPTLTSIFIEHQFENIFRLTKNNTNAIGSISYNFIDEEAKEFLRCLIIADRRAKELNTEGTFQTWEAHGGSEFEKLFFENVFNQFGVDANQLLQLQRTITSIVGGKIAGQDLFYHQNTDFVLEFPKYENNSKGLIIEIDGSQHNELAQKEKDNQRTFWADKNEYETVRIKTSEIKNIPNDVQNAIKTYLKHPFFQYFSENIEKSLFSNEQGLDYLQLYLSPFGISRVQKAIIKALKSGLIDFEKSMINIAVIERDIPCGKIAIDDLLLQIKHLSILQNGIEYKLPEFKVSIFNTMEFATAKLNKENNCQLFSNSVDFKNYDLVIDISVLNYSTFLNRPVQSLARQTIVIKSLHHTEAKRKFNFYPSIEYFNVPENKEDRSIENLNFFLQSFFRKQTFREGQVEILSKALQKKNPIALLPTGAGKSLTYQVASLLQAGLVIVIDPIKALMKDQNENLKNSLIDATIYINSTLSAKEKEENIKSFSQGEYLFAFVSPERFVIEDFRRQISQIKNYGKNFAFCIIDEAHCVSEWGHDFRTAYLKLGDNSRQYCFSGIEGESIPTMGLTGTASFDVLSDVQREVGLQNDSDIIRPKVLERKELKFKIKNVNATAVGGGFWQIQDSVFSALKQGLTNILKNDLIAEKHLENCNVITFPDFIKYQGENSNCGIIFCPHSTDKMASGVQHIAKFLRTEFPDIAHLIGEYYGSGDSKLLEKVQDDFKSNKITLLVATKAFGMGIDKPNIRFTIHITYPISIEGFYQEAGRGGRDRNNAVAYILHCNNLLLPNGKSVARNVQDTFLFNSFKGQNYEKNITFELLDKITFPHTTNKDQTQENILQITGREIKIGKPFPNPPSIPHTYYINGEEFGQTFGTININTLDISTKGKKGLDGICTEDDATHILTNIANFIQENNPNKMDLISWFAHINATPQQNGIESFVRKIPNNQTNTITIGLENNGVQSVVDYLNSFSNPLFDYGIVKKSTPFCQSDDDFIDNLKKNYKKIHGLGVALTFTSPQISEIKHLYTQIRSDQDTFKIIYRLSILGVVKDYTIQYPCFATLICQNQTDEEIYYNLHKHFLRYYPEKYVLNLMQQARNKKDSALRNCIDTLIDFTYDNVFDKRQKALNNMSEAVEKAIVEKTKTNEENGNLTFATTVNDYFDSQFVEEIRKVSENGSKVDFSVFEHFANIAVNNDQLRQLENSAKRSLEFYNRNPIISLIQYYSSTLINEVDNSELLNTTKNLYVLENGFSIEQFDEIISNVTNYIARKSQKSLTLHHSNIETVLSKHALSQIQNLNFKFLEQYV
jgi:RecQ family ATP-dependent DNA helicase